MKPFLAWLDEHGFRVREYWDLETRTWRHDGFLQLMPFQRQLLGHALHLREDGRFPYQNFIYSAPKKSGKTAIAAALVAWAADCFPPGSEIYIIANDLEQAEGRVMRDVKYHAEREVPEVYVTQYRLEYPNGTFVQSLSQHYRSAAGARHAVTVWDELWGYSTEGSRRMWAEMTPIPTVPHSLRFVSTYAGFENESDLLWEQYIRGVGPDEYKGAEEEGRGQGVPGFEDLPVWRNGRTLTYWDHEPRMPWQDEEYYDEAREVERPADYLRLHENRWVSSHEAFIDISWWDRAAKAYKQSADLWDEHPYRHWPLYIGVDVAVKHDRTAAAAVAYDHKRGKVILVTGRIWTPAQGEKFDIENTVERWLLDLRRRFTIRGVYYDPYQFHRSMMSLQRAGLHMIEFQQSAGNMVSASQQLYELLRKNHLEAYPDDEARAHIKNAAAKDTGRGFRIVKDDSEKRGSSRVRGRKPNDFAVALAMACHAAVESGGVDTSRPLRIESPFADVSAWKPEHDPVQATLPFPLRSD